MDSSTPTSSSITTTTSPNSSNSNPVTPTTTFGARTREWISSWQPDMSNHHYSTSSSVTSRSYYNLDRNGQKMPDLLIDQSPVGTKRVWIGERDPIQIEKSNLVNILKLVIKEVLDSSLRFGHQLDSDHIPLQHFFIVLEHILKHGMKGKKGLLGPKKELWDLLQLVEKKELEAVDITASVRELPTVKSALGRARAWLRLALMQKKLADYFRHLVDQGRDVLSEYYEPRALLRSEEAAIVTGLLLSLNVVDCNLCVKEEDLESQQGVIDFSLYLRNNKDVGGSPSSNDLAASTSTTGGASTSTDIAAVLDQKNYIEELNRHLNATVNSMQGKIEGLSTTNALMKEDLSICQNALFKSQEENKKLLSQLGGAGSNDHYQISTDKNIIGLRRSADSSSYLSNSAQKDAEIETKRKLVDEMKKGEELQKELRLQKSMKAEMEVAMKLLEKDVHEKQDTIRALRDQLEDIKSINLDMYTKLQETEKSMKHKADLILRLEGKSSAMADSLKKLDIKYVKSEVEKKSAMNTLTNLREAILTKEHAISKVESDLKIEKEWRLQLQKTSEADKETLYKLQEDSRQLKDMLKAQEKIRLENESLRATIKENEDTLEDMASKLSESTLEIEALRENQKIQLGPKSWMDDAEVKHCPICEKDFTMSRRKHHCRHCGGIFCDDCSSTKLALASSKKPERVCDNCYHLLLDQLATMSTS